MLSLKMNIHLESNFTFFTRTHVKRQVVLKKIKEQHKSLLSVTEREFLNGGSFQLEEFLIRLIQLWDAKRFYWSLCSPASFMKYLGGSHFVDSALCRF